MGLADKCHEGAPRDGPCALHRRERANLAKPADGSGPSCNSHTWACWPMWAHSSLSTRSGERGRGNGPHTPPWSRAFGAAGHPSLTFGALITAGDDHRDDDYGGGWLSRREADQ